MSYIDVVAVYDSEWLRRRAVACAALEGIEDPEVWLTTQRRWQLAASPGWADAWAYFKATNPDDRDPGDNEDVITDGMILSAVQAIVNGE
jgi:hypothetical protein